MKFSSLSAAIILPSILGFLITLKLSSEIKARDLIKYFFHGTGIGIGITSYTLFLLSYLGVQLSLTKVLLFYTPIIIVLLAINNKKWSEVFQKSVLEFPAPKQPARFNFSFILTLVLTCWLLMKILFVLYENTIWPIHAWDSWENWSAGAKLFFYEKGISFDKNSPLFIGDSYRTHLSYPLNTVLIQVWYSIWLGEFHEIYSKFWSAVFFIGILGTLFYSLLDEAGFPKAIAATFFLSTVPLLTYHSLTAYADMPLSFYILVMSIALRELILKTEKNSDKEIKQLLMIGIIAGLAIWTKLEGIFYVFAFSIALSSFTFFQKRSFTRLWAFFLPIFIIAGPWFIFLLLNEVAIGRGEEMSGFHFEVFPIIWEQLVHSANFNLIFPFFLIFSILNIRYILCSELKYLFGALMIVAALFVSLYITTYNYEWVINLGVINRNILTLIPTVYYLTSLIVINTWTENIPPRHVQNINQ